MIYCWSFSVYAQKEKVFIDEWNQIEQSNSLTLKEKKAWFDNWIKANNKLKNPDQVAKTYYFFLIAFLKTGSIENSIDCSLQIQSIGTNHNIKSDFFVKNDKNLVNLYYKNDDYYKVISSGNNYIKKYPKKTVRLGQIYRFLGNAYSDIGDFEKAISYYNKAIYTFKELNNSNQEGRTLINLLEVYVKLESKFYSNDIIKTLDIIDSIDTFSDKDIIAKSLNAGVFYDFSNDFSNAKSNYKTALKLSYKLDDSLNVFKSLINLGIVYKKQDSLSKAKDIFREAYTYSLNNKENEASLFNNLADVFKTENNYEKALNYYDKAILKVLDAQNLKIENLDVLYNKIDLLGYLIDKANVLILINETNNNENYLKQALNIYDIADKIIDVIYFESREDLSKLFWRKQANDIYVNAINAAYKLNKPNKVFYFIEKSKALLLLENITESNAKAQANLPNILIEREFKLKNEINKTEIILSEYKSKKVSLSILDSIKNQVFVKKRKYSDFIDSLEVISPRYYDYKKKINVFSKKMVQESLKKDEIVLQYKFTLNKGYLVFLSHEDVKLYELKNIKNIHSDLNQYKKAINKPFIKQEDSRDFKKLSASLFSSLLPLANKNILIDKKVIIIPDGLLQTIPFEPLVLNNKESLNMSYLINYCDISYAYSFSSLKNSLNKKIKFKNNFFAISPSKFNDKTLPDLIISDDEVNQIETLLNTKLLINNLATKETFLNNYGKSKVVHISTHGGIIDNNPWIAFNDKKLMLNDMYFNNKQADIVVLNACKTSQGEHKKGEGIMSIARAFSNSGAKSVVSSLWDINQKSSNEIITEFYKNIKLGLSKANALREAKLVYLNKYSNTSEASPYFWSGVILTGDESAIMPKNRPIWLILLITLISTIVIVKWFFYKK